MARHKCGWNGTAALWAAMVALALPACAAEKAAPKVVFDEKAGAVTVQSRLAKKGENAAARFVLVGADGKETDVSFATDATAQEIVEALAKLRLQPGGGVVVVIQRAAAAVRRVHVFISGDVQGVGFRDFTQRSARALKLTGWVRNLRDGRVEAIIEGPNAQVDALLEKIKKGPSSARVTKFQPTEEEAKGEFKDFDVLR